MALSKFPLIRYKVLDKCFRTSYKKYFIEDLVMECNHVLYEMTGKQESVKLRQIRDDISFMRSPEGWDIELAELFDGKKRVYRYEDTSFSIMNLPINDKIMQDFRSSVEVLSQFEGMPQFDWLQESLAKMNMEVQNNYSTTVIAFDSNPYLKGIEYLSSLYHAIKNKTVLCIEYQDFNAPEPYTLTLHPYFLKQYNNRWFLLGLNTSTQVPTWNLAIDRIKRITESADSYIVNSLIDWADYFDDIIGVTKMQDAAAEDILLYFYGVTGKYIESKPLHGSQKSRWVDETTLEVKLHLIINFELERLILSYGSHVKVASPEKLKTTIIQNIQSSLKQYT